MNILGTWFTATALLLAVALIWAYAPVLIPLLGITAGLGVLVAAIVAVGRKVERKQAERDR